MLVAAVVFLSFREDRRPTTLEGLFDEFQESGHRVGIGSPFSGVVLVARDDEVVFQEAYGFADVEGLQPLDVQSRFIVGAGATPFTAVLVLQQVEAGVLDLNGTLADYLPNIPHEAAATITLHQLLSHTSGLPRESDPWDQLTLEFEPGTAFSFSNLGYDLLIEILLKVTGKGYQSLFEEGIVTPLGLTGTGLVHGDSLKESTADGMNFRQYEFPETMFASTEGKYRRVGIPEGAAVQSTVEDLHRFVQGLRSDQLLSAEWTRKLFEPTLNGSAYGWRRNDARLFRHNPESPFYLHEGLLAGHAAWIALHDDGTTIIVLSNVRPLDGIEVLDSTYLVTHGLENVETSLTRPRLGNLREFKDDGGVDAFTAYYRELSQKAGYSIAPASDLCARVVRLLLRDGNPEQAIEFTDTILQDWSPTSSEIFNDIGYSFMSQNESEAARRFFVRNIELFPDTPNGYDSLGESYERDGDLVHARENYQLALEVAHENGDGMAFFYEQRLADLE